MAAESTPRRGSSKAIGARRYHLLKPTYIYGRIKELQRAFRTRVLLCHVDVDDVVEPLAQVTKAALLNDCTLICAWSHEVSLGTLLCCIFRLSMAVYGYLQLLNEHAKVQTLSFLV